MAERDREIEKDMQRALKYQARSLGNFYRGIMTSLRYINTTMEKYAQERGGLTIEEAAAELELIKEIERTYVRLQMLRSRHDNWLQARKKVTELQRGISGAAAARPAQKPASPPPPPTPKPPEPKPVVEKETPPPETSKKTPDKEPLTPTPPFMVSSPPPPPKKEK